MVVCILNFPETKHGLILIFEGIELGVIKNDCVFLALPKSANVNVILPAILLLGASIRLPDGMNSKTDDPAIRSSPVNVPFVKNATDDVECISPRPVTTPVADKDTFDDADNDDKPVKAAAGLNVIDSED